MLFCGVEPKTRALTEWAGSFRTSSNGGEIYTRFLRISKQSRRTRRGHSATSAPTNTNLAAWCSAMPTGEQRRSCRVIDTEFRKSVTYQRQTNGHMEFLPEQRQYCAKRRIHRSFAPGHLRRPPPRPRCLYQPWPAATAIPVRGTAFFVPHPGCAGTVHSALCRA